MTPAPIALFVYNRPEHTRKAVSSLQHNVLAAESELYIYSDGPAHATHAAAVEQVRRFAAEITGFKKVTIIKSDRNLGLAASIIRGVTDMVNRHGKVIVLEDDLVLSPYFLQFMNDGLEKYEHRQEVISIHGYNVDIKYHEPVFFLRGADCWGWATWARGWKLFNADGEYLMRELKKRKLLYYFDMDGNYPYTQMLERQIRGKINSWAVRWLASAFIHNKLTLYPTHSLVRNIGGDGSGTHQGEEDTYNVDLNMERVIIPDIPIEESLDARRLVGKHLYKFLSLKGKLRKLFRGLSRW